MKTNTRFRTYLVQFLRMKNVSAKAVEEIETQNLCSVTFFFFENHAVCVTMWKNYVERDKSQMTI